MKVVFDTNVLISALLWDGRVTKLLCRLRSDKLILCFSLETIAEFVDVVKRPKFSKRLARKKYTPQKILDEILSSKPKFFAPDRGFPILVKDPSDDKFIHLAALAKAEYIVSGDKALLELKEYKGVRIVSVAEFLKVFSK